MKKIIVKCKLKNKEEFERKLHEIEMDFSPIYWLHDRVYVPRNYQGHANYPRLILRTEMRAVDKPAKYTLIMRRHIEDSGIDIVDETVVKDYAETANIILQLGFKAKAEVSRQRKDQSMGAGVTLVVDKVEGLPGYYAKLEAVLGNDDKVSEVREDMENTFRVLGQTSEVIREPYADMN